ncbi:short-chain dehydrogenase [Thermobispora bispora]|jgi:NAD(P)-dependent dehydrogenase (short-subunit alcohol dehydrogenase family)|uniref:Short-chain dehydrogenase/reductase SDR n=1 Tax=Thermobispora bispora (strain ATCC 19993 / DSM 43833 / CBS 139.67 / JCM 10125 / KCTC 9307 / NBRC 14880 / R51) TaxID=469371 RepID=D6Y5E4_THEBD|nr:SDR family oxidoreductase [Thermobispora bispora]ADG89339.1 short-chain dehydrogenase/reductase SDR [Thermobispora bispora DSM 43833]
MLGTVLITGGASGLGRATVEAVAKAGGRPLVIDLRACAGDVEHVCADLADRDQAERAVRELAERAGGLDGVVTCAGIDVCGRLEDVPADRWERVIRVNLIGTAAVVRAALPYLRRSRGTVVTVASTLGLRAVSDATAYCASKFGVVGFTRALAAELGDEVGVTLLIPGGMRTAFFDGRDEKYRPGPGVTLSRPEDVADAIVYALGRPPSCQVRELVVCPGTETSWP